MSKIIINNSTVYIYNHEEDVQKAKDELLTKLYYARYKSTMGGYEAWLQLLDWYYSFKYNKMIEFIKSCKGKGGKTRYDCINLIYTIMGGSH